MMSQEDSDLQFQDFGHQVTKEVTTTKDDKGATIYTFDHEQGGDKDTSKLLSPEDGGPLPSFWTFEYYQQYFNVDTDQVINRLINSMVPRKGGNFITQHIRPVPDLYGPFWISVTLIFAMGIFGNLTKYFETAGHNQDYHWEYDFGIVTAGATIMFVYVVVLPGLLYTVFWYRKYDTDYTYLELVALYGYSLTILWVIHVDIFRWILIGIAVLMSGSVLAITLWQAVKSDQKLIAYGIIVGVLLLHTLLAVGFKEYFFEATMTDRDMNSVTKIPQNAMTPQNVQKFNNSGLNKKNSENGSPVLTGMQKDTPAWKEEEKPVKSGENPAKTGEKPVGNEEKLVKNKEKPGKNE